MLKAVTGPHPAKKVGQTYGQRSNRQGDQTQAAVPASAVPGSSAEAYLGPALYDRERLRPLPWL